MDRRDEGLSHHEAARQFGIDRRTVKKMLSYSLPAGYRRRRRVRPPKLDRFTGVIAVILEAERDEPHKGRVGPTRAPPWTHRQAHTEIVVYL